MACLLGVACSEPNGFHYRSQPTMSADRARVIASVNVAGHPSIYDLSLRGEAPVRLTDGADVSPAVSPDGRLVVFARQQSDERQSLYLIDRHDGRTRALTEAAHDDFPVFLDHQRVAFLRAQRLRDTSTGGQRWVDWDVFVVDVPTSEVRPLTSAGYWDVTPLSAVPGGSGLLFTAEQLGKPSRPILVNVSNGETKPVGLADDGPAVAGDTGLMIVVRRTGTDPQTDAYIYDLFESRLDGAQRRQLTDLKTYSDRPSYQRDAGVLLFLATESRTGSFELWQMTTSGVPARATVRLP
jgi:Tol biopolymer transport system component